MTTYIKKSTLLAYLEREKNVHGSLFREMSTQNVDTHDPLERFAGSIRESIKYVVFADVVRAVEDGTFDVRINGGEEVATMRDDGLVRRSAKAVVDWDTVGMDDEDDVEDDGKPVTVKMMGITAHSRRSPLRVTHPARRSWWSRLWSWLTFRRP